MQHTGPVYDSFMRHAMDLARRATRQTAPNPCVGAVLVHNGCVVAEGWHKGPGQPHAEVECLNDALAKGVTPSQCTLVVTLEPCNHYGKTPPCTQAILAAGIQTVVIGAMDPTNAGGGAAFLQQQGVTVLRSELEQECRDLIDDFLTWNTTPLPYLTIKLASTMDGRIATRTGHSKWITSDETRHEVHALRNGMNALIVGGNTFYQDDPKLTCRQEAFLQENKEQPLAIVVTSRLPGVEGNHYLLRERPSSTLFWTTVAAAASPKAEALRKIGVRVLGLPSKARPNERGYGMRAELSLSEGLEYLRKELGCYYVLCEGGGRLALSMLDAGLAKELHLHLAPKILGDNDATALFDGRAPILMDEALQLRITGSRLGPTDIMLTMRPAVPAQSTAKAEDK